MEKKYELLLISLFIVFIGGFFLANLVMPDREFSLKENRELQTLPEFSLGSLFSGSYTKAYEEFCADQFALRDGWIELKAALELSQGKGENNGVFLCEGERLIEPFTAPAEPELQRRAKIVQTLAENVEVPVTLALIPSSAELCASLLPVGVKNDSQQRVIDSVAAQIGVPSADIGSILKAHRDEELFYRTDHHWTTLGACYAYQALSPLLGVEALDIESFSPKTVSESFCGTTYSSSGFFWVKPDRMESYVEEPNGLTVLRYEKKEPVVSSLYHEEMLSTKDKYRYFLGGNAPRVVLETGHTDLPSLLLIRDSYADSLVPFLLPHFSQIHLLDLRYYREPITEYVRDNGIDRVCVIYSVSNFCTDTNLAMMTR